MSEKQSLASKAKWANIPKEERTRIMTERAKQRAVKMSQEQLKKHSIKMNEKRWKK